MAMASPFPQGLFSGVPVEEPQLAAEEVLEEDEDFTCYMSKLLLDGLKKLLSSGSEISRETVKALTQLDKVGDEEIVVPIDMRVLLDYADEDDMLDKLGPKAAAEAFVQGYEDFTKCQEARNVPEDERPKPMTAKEWRTILEDEDCGPPPVLTEEQVIQLFGAHAVEEIAGSDNEDDEDDEQGLSAKPASTTPEPANKRTDESKAEEPAAKRTKKKA